MKRSFLLPFAGLFLLALPVLAQGSHDAGTAAAPPTPPTSSAGAPAGAGAPPSAQPRYMATVQSELTAMGIQAQCRAHSPMLAHCAYQYRGAGTGHTFDIHLTYDDESDTVYIYVDRFVMAPESNPRTGRVLQQLMSLNWDILIGKFEWDRTDGEVRLSAVVNTDSNFDRRSFRSTVRAVQALADRHYNEVSRLLTAG